MTFTHDDENQPMKTTSSLETSFLADETMSEDGMEMPESLVEHSDELLAQTSAVVDDNFENEAAPVEDVPGQEDIPEVVQAPQPLTSSRWWALSVCLVVLGVISIMFAYLMRDSPASADTAMSALYPAVMPTATKLTSTISTKDGMYDNPDAGVTFYYPADWKTGSESNETTLLTLASPNKSVGMFVSRVANDTNYTPQDVAYQIAKSLTWLVDTTSLKDEAITVSGASAAWRYESSGISEASASSNIKAHLVVVVADYSGGTLALIALVPEDRYSTYSNTFDDIIAGVNLHMPTIYGLPRNDTFVLQAGESDNARLYDPANGAGDNLVFSGLVKFDQSLNVLPDLASWWEVSTDGTVYTFHLNPDAIFHNGRPVTADDVIYSWERAANPKTDSNTVLTYLGDIVGVGDMRAGKAEHIIGLKALDKHTLQVTIAAPKPYFLMKLSYSVAYVVEKSNIESGSSWYRTPIGTGPYRLVSWDTEKILYERFDRYYGDLPKIRYYAAPIYAGAGLQLYETGKEDISGVGAYDLERILSPDEPMHDELVQSVSMCTSYITFDMSQAPFDDMKVRQAFAMSVNKQQYIDLLENGQGIVANGLYPPALPGFSTDLKGLEYNPERARQLLAESRYGGADKLPPIIYSSAGYGSYASSSVGALIQMWEQNLGVKIEVRNIEPDSWDDELHSGRHGQLLSYGWCADYPDPENFADTLFHTGAENNLGHYSNPELDALLEKARTEGDSNARLALYKQAEQIIVNDAPAVFIEHHKSFVLVKPYLKGYVPVPINIPFLPYLSIDESELK